MGAYNCCEVFVIQWRSKAPTSAPSTIHLQNTTLKKWDARTASIILCQISTSAKTVHHHLILYQEVNSSTINTIRYSSNALCLSLMKAHFKTKLFCLTKTYFWKVHHTKWPLGPYTCSIFFFCIHLLNLSKSSYISSCDELFPIPQVSH